MNFVRTVFLLLLGALLGASHVAPVWAESGLDQDMQIWAPVNLEVPVTERARILLQAQGRWTDNVSDFTLFRLRPAGAYQLTENISVAAGYMWEPALKGSPLEQRVWEQAMVTVPLRKQFVVNRFRLEQVFREGVGTTGHRGRYFLSYFHPIGESDWSLILGDEIIFNFNSYGNIRAGFEQNRWYAGVRRDINELVFVEGGYMLQLINRNQAPNGLNHNVYLRLNVTTPTLSKLGKPPVPPMEDFRRPQEDLNF
jgi:hypothetical protein